MTENAYKQAGVDIEAGAKLVERIKPHVKKTARSGVMAGLGGFGALFDLKATGFKDPVLVAANDGVGTKLKIAIETNQHKTVGIDLVAMCVNDLVVQGAEPLFFLDYFASGKLDVSQAEEVIAGIAKGCEIAGCALIGGETAEMPSMYADGDYDLAGFSVGAVERDKILTGENVKEGDVILGIASNGVHSNGFSLVRRLIENSDELSYSLKAPFDNAYTLGEAFLTPTRIYVKPLLNALKIGGVHGLSHITGGGFLENVPRSVPKGLKAEVDTTSWSLPSVFQWLKDVGNLSNQDLSTTFNCGIGMIVFCDPSKVTQIKSSLESDGESVFEIGCISKSNDGNQIDMLGQDAAW